MPDRHFFLNRARFLDCLTILGTVGGSSSRPIIVLGALGPPHFFLNRARFAVNPALDSSKLAADEQTHCVRPIRYGANQLATAAPRPCNDFNHLSNAEWSTLKKAADKSSSVSSDARVLKHSTFLRYGDLLAENCEFFLPQSHLTPSLGVNPFEFLDELFIPKTRVLGLSVGEDFVILACVVFTQCQRVTDGQTDGQRERRTNNQTVANTVLCIASYAEAP